jgi:energy-coupling factor transporter ATP-binding protein EcfA2
VKLKRLAINRIPGISQPFEINAADAGFNVVFGPNGIGKSSLCRAVEGLFWDDHGSSQRTSVSGEFELDGETWWAEREGSRVRWQRGGEDSVPPNLPASHNHRCFLLRLRDLIDPSPDGTQDIASEIRRQMSGGFDLDQIAAELFEGVGTQHGRREWRDFNKTSQDVQEAEAKQLGLQRRADQLNALRGQLDAADSSAQRLSAVERALGLAGRLEEYVGVTEELAALPDGLAKLTGREAEQIEALQVQIDGLNERARTLEAQCKTAGDAKRDSRLVAPLGQAELSIWRENADELGRVELTLQAARAERSACRREFAAALSALGEGNVDDVDLDLSDHGQLFELLRAVEAHKARANAINERLRLLAHVDLPEDTQRDLEISRSAADALRFWLRAPEPETLSEKLRTRRPWILFALVLAIVGVGSAVFVDPMFALLAAVGLGVAVPVFFLRNLSASSGARASAQDAFAKLEIEEPDAWDLPSVELRLRRLEGEISTLDSRMQRARDRDVERQTLENELAGLAEEEAVLGARRQKLTDSLKLDAIPPDAELIDFARSLDQLRSARIKDESAAGKVDHLETRHGSLLFDLATVLGRHGEPQPDDAKTAGAYLNSLADRDARLLQAISDEQRTTDQLEQVSTDRGTALNSIKKIYADLSLVEGDLPGLTTLLSSLPHYLELKSAAVRLEAQIALDRDALTKAGESSLAECDGPTLERLQGELSQVAENAAGLRDEIAEINAQVNEAKRGSNVQELFASREEDRAKLMDRLDEALFAKAGKFLINAVEEEYEQTQMPRVFERARSHFSAFTHHNYELRLGREAKAPRLFAVELRSGEGRGLDELSDGTRAQLLLAARIAFAEEVEQGKTMPLFLDEALDQSDPARFEAIVRSLGRVANEQDRQIFYLTSDPLDIDRIRLALAKENCEIAAAIDLGLIRTKSASVTGPQALHVLPMPTVPAPDGLPAEAYGIALSVPQLAPAMGYEQQHFFYVLSDELNLLHAFLVNGIERVGQWKTVSGTALADKLGSDAISSLEIEARTDLLQVFCELWKQGRGRPVDRDALEHSGALSERYLEDVVEIARELAGDPEKLLSTLGAGKDPRLKGFRKNSFDRIERYLRDNVYIDDQPVLNESELRLRALASPAANKLPNGVAIDCLNRWWSWSVILPEPEPA